MNEKIVVVVCKLLSAFFSFVFLWLVAKILSVEEAGVFMYSYAVIAVMIQISRAGGEHYIISKSIDYKNGLSPRRDFYVMSSVMITVILMFSSVFMVLNEVFVFKAYYSGIGVFLIFSLSACFFGISQLYSSFFQSQQMVIQQYIGLNLGLVMLGSGFNFILYIFDISVDVEGVSFIFLLSSVLLFLYCSHVFLKMSRQSVFAEYQIACFNEYFKRTVKELRPYFLITFISVVVHLGGQFLSGLWLSSDELAILSVCQRVGFLVGFIFYAYSGLLGPIISSLYRESKIIPQKVISSYSIYSNIYVFIMIVFFYLYGEWLLGFFGEEYKAGYSSLLVIAGGMALVSILGQGGILLLMSGNSNVLRKNLIISSVFSVILSVAIIEEFRVIGASVCIVVPIVLCSILNNFSCRKLNLADLCGFEDFKLQCACFNGLIHSIYSRLISGLR